MILLLFSETKQKVLGKGGCIYLIDEYLGIYNIGPPGRPVIQYLSSRGVLERFLSQELGP